MNDPWARAEAALAAKMLAELCFEEELTATPQGGGRFAVPVGAVTWTFAGRRVALDGWRVDPGSVRREGEVSAPDRLLLDLHAARGLDPQVTALTLTELSSTLAADVRLLRTALPAAELADLGHAQLEGHMTGHPWLVANKGRVGFSASDTERWAPEARRPLRLPWIAVHPSLATRTGTDVELPFGRPGAVLLPVHPWQWDEVVSTWFARQVADGLIEPLGEGPDSYLPQQSIRTFTNLSTPHRHDVKVSLSILNTMVYRGIPSELVDAAPHGTRWLHALRDADPFLAGECRLVLPGEVAAASVRHPALEAVPGGPYRYRQLLGVIWREPLAGLLDAGERARTFASLLHVDPAGRSLLGELVRRSGLPPAGWLDRLLGVVLPPLLHLLVRYGLALNPHGENATIVYDDRDVPVRLAVKDFVDDMKLLDLGGGADAERLRVPEHDDLPPQVLGVLLREGPEDLVGSLAKSVLLGHFRYLAPLAEEQLGVPEAEFWRLARAQVEGYRRRFPELAERFALLDVTTPVLQRVVLNRERLLPGGYHDRAERDAHFDLRATGVPNPLHDRGER